MLRGGWINPDPPHGGFYEISIQNHVTPDYQVFYGSTNSKTPKLALSGALRTKADKTFYSDRARASLGGCAILKIL